MPIRAIDRIKKATGIQTDGSLKLFKTERVLRFRFGRCCQSLFRGFDALRGLCVIPFGGLQ